MRGSGTPIHGDGLPNWSARTSGAVAFLGAFLGASCAEEVDQVPDLKTDECVGLSRNLYC